MIEDLIVLDDVDKGERPYGSGWDIGADEEGVVGDTGGGGTGNCCDLGPNLVPDYLSEMPEDPTDGDLEGTGNSGYYIKRRPSENPWIWAQHASEYAEEGIIVKQ